MSDYVTELRRTSSRRRRASSIAAAPAARRARCTRGRGRRRRWPARWRSRPRWSPWCVTLTTLAPPPQPADAKVVATVRLGGQPRDAVLAGGRCGSPTTRAAWCRLDPAARRVRARIRVGGTPVSVAADGDRVLGGEHRRRPGVDALAPVPARRPRAGSVLDARRRSTATATAIAAGAGGLWLSRALATAATRAHRPGHPPAHRADPGRPTSWPGRDGAVGVDATSRTPCPRSTRRRPRRQPRARVSPTDGRAERAHAAPRRRRRLGGGQSDGLLYRVEGGRVVRRVEVGRPRASSSASAPRSGSARPSARRHATSSCASIPTTAR